MSTSIWLHKVSSRDVSKKRQCDDGMKLVSRMLRMDRQHTNWERDASLVEIDSCSAKVNEERKTRRSMR